MDKNELLELVENYSQRLKEYKKLPVDALTECGNLADSIIRDYNKIKSFVLANSKEFTEDTVEYISSEGFCGNITNTELEPLNSYDTLKTELSNTYANLAKEALLSENESLFVLNSIKALDLTPNSDIFKTLVPMFQSDEKAPHILARLYENIFNITKEASYAKSAGLIWADKVNFADGAIENLKKYVEIEQNDVSMLWKISDISGTEQQWQDQVKYMAMALRKEAKNA